MSGDDFSLDDLTGIEGFEWDEANIVKNREKHHAEPKESEEAFFNKPTIFLKDPMHSTEKERRYGILGQTNDGRKLAIYFTVRNKKIRVISSRDMGKIDRATYIIEEERQMKAEKR